MARLPGPRQLGPRQRILLGGLSSLVLLTLAAAALSAGMAVGSDSAEVRQPDQLDSAAATQPPPTPTPTPTPTPRAVPADPAEPVRLRTCSIAGAASDERLANFQGQVRDADSGEVLFDRKGSTASRTASVLKVITSAAALEVLGPDYRIPTRVVRGEDPGTVVLVGGGDPTLSRTPSGNETAYAGAAHLDDLAEQVLDAWADDPVTAGTPLTTVVLDSSYFGGRRWQPSWLRKELYDGYMPEITALMVDGDRDDPYSNTSTRSEDPVQRAGKAFAAELGGVAIESGTAPADAQVLGEVRSQPVSTLIAQTLIVSDNTIAEALARVTAIEAGAGNTFGDLQQGIVGAMDAYGIDTGKLRIVDGSGLSGDNAVPPAYLTKLMVKILKRQGDLGIIYDGLPIAGETGSLSYSDRFSGDSARATGDVHAKTGWIDDGYTLAGSIDAADGTELTFAFYALGDVNEGAKQALDALAAATWDCGGNLSDR